MGLGCFQKEVVWGGGERESTRALARLKKPLFLKIASMGRKNEEGGGGLWEEDRRKKSP